MSYLMNHTVNNDVMIYIDSFQFLISKVSGGNPPKPVLPPPPPPRDSDTPSPLLLRRSRRPTGVMHAFSLCIIYLSWLHCDFTCFLRTSAPINAVSCINVLHNIFPRPLAAFPDHGSSDNSQLWRGSSTLRKEIDRYFGGLGGYHQCLSGIKPCTSFVKQKGLAYIKIQRTCILFFDHAVLDTTLI